MSRRIRSGLVSKASFALIGLACAAAAIAAVRGEVSPPRAHALSSASAPRVLRAPGERPYLADASGRWLFLRGVAVSGLVQYGPNYDENPPLTRADFTEIAALGFDYVRLAASWSLIEPRPGAISAAYLDHVAQAVAWARSAGLDVLVDLHGDRYNRGLAPGDEADGAPDWATLTDTGTARAPAACVSARGSAACIQAAWQSFWADARSGGIGLQRHYIDALLAVSRRLRSASNLLGLELMNNPGTGTVPSPAFERHELWPFWNRAIRALRSDGERRPLWLEPASSSEQTGSDPAKGVRFSHDSQLVYAPHDYAGVFSPPPWPSGGAASLQPWYSGSVRQAEAFAMAPIVGEWGTGTGAESDAWIQDQLDLQNQFRIGSAFWIWKQRPGFYNWPVVAENGDLRTDSARAQELAEPHPDAIPGILLEVRYLPAGSLTIRLRGKGGTATAWSGTDVLRGGGVPSPPALTRALIDGRPVRVRLTARHFSSAGVALRGDVVSFSVPTGTHTIVLAPGA